MTAAPSRRGHTRRLLIVPLLGLAALVGGIVALEAAAPQVDPATIEALSLEDDLPPLALDDVPTCTRAVLEELTTTELRGEFRAGDRISSEQVYACPDAWDGQDVTFVGEAIGELLHRDGGVWVQVNDDDYALRTGPLVGHRERSGSNSGLSVWLPDGLHEQVDGVGRPDTRGTVMELRGELLRADPDDGGGTTLRVEELEVVAPAVTVEEPLHVLQIAVAGVLAALAGAALWWARRVRRR